MKKLLVFVCAMFLLLGTAGISFATLWDRGGGLIYDDVLDITWLQDANYAQTSGYDSYGVMTWDAAMTWADQLVYGGYNDWRLPLTDESQANLNGGFGYEGPDGTGYHDYRYGYNMVNSEMGHLFYETLGNKGYYATDGTAPQSGWGLQNTGPFDNLQPGYYWSGTEDSPYPYYAWVLNFFSGYQISTNKDGDVYAWAVRPGDVSAVPVPATMLLLGSGLAGLGVFRRKIKWIHG